MGETTDGGLYEIFQQDYGPVGSPSFEAARENFIISSAGYAVASLLLQPKDRHNGNLLFDKYDLLYIHNLRSNFVTDERKIYWPDMRNKFQAILWSLDIMLCKFRNLIIFFA